ncbi:MAG TPA: hypothetical protein VG755_18790 [Nannocystaceae bacterium]|nr:hypothetical protein [Nannocystaceae bacterium]
MLPTVTVEPTLVVIMPSSSPPHPAASTPSTHHLVFVDRRIAKHESSERANHRMHGSTTTSPYAEPSNALSNLHNAVQPA